MTEHRSTLRSANAHSRLRKNTRRHRPYLGPRGAKADMCPAGRREIVIILPDVARVRSGLASHVELINFLSFFGRE